MIIQPGVTAGASYSFNAGAKTITFSGTVPANLESIAIVSNNVTGALMFAPGGGAALAGTFSGSVLTLACDTTGMANGNALTILFENGAAQAVAPNVTRGGGVIDANTQRVTLASDGPTVSTLASIDAKMPAAPATAALQTAGNTSLGNIDTGLGTDGTSPPTLPGGSTGVRGWLRYMTSLWPALVGGRWPVDGSGVTQPVSGTITANAGTNLDTSLLALESGGNLAGINGKLPALSAGRIPVALPPGGSGLTDSELRASALPLPTGAATETTLGALNGKIPSNLTVSSTRLLVDGSSVTQPVTMASKTTITSAASSAANTNLLTGNVSDWYDAAAFQFATVNAIGSAGISAGQIIFEGTNDTAAAPSGYSLPYVVANSAAPVLTVGAFAVAANSSTPYSIPITTRFFRVRISTAFTGGTVIAAVTLSNQPTPFPVAYTTAVANAAVNLSQVAGVATLGYTTPAGARMLAVMPHGGVSNTDANAANWAAASGNTGGFSAVLASATAFLVTVSAFTAGSSTGLDIFLQVDLGSSNWFDYYQCEAFTGTGTITVPPLPLACNQRRWRWAHRGGAATTSTVTIAAVGGPHSPPRQVQWFDRTSGVGSGTAVLNTTSASYDIAGVIPTVVLDCGTATAVGSFQVEMSLTGAANSWYAASAATAVNSTSANRTLIPLTAGVRGKFLRVVCTAAGTSQVMNAIHVYGGPT